MAIRPGRHEDVDALASLWVTLAREQQSYGSHLRAEDNRQAIEAMLTRHVVTDGVLVAEADQIEGFVTFQAATGQFAEDISRGSINNLMVRPASRNDGIGSALLSAAEEALAEEGIEVVTLEAMANNDGARRFYRDRGYDIHRITFEKEIETDTGNSH